MPETPRSAQSEANKRKVANLQEDRIAGGRQVKAKIVWFSSVKSHGVVDTEAVGSRDEDPSVFTTLSFFTVVAAQQIK